MCVFFLNVDIPQLKEFASDPQVQDSLRHMKAAFNNSSQSVQQPQGQEAITDEDDDMPPEDSSQFRVVVDLGKMVLKGSYERW